MFLRTGLGGAAFPAPSVHFTALGLHRDGFQAPKVPRCHRQCRPRVSPELCGLTGDSGWAQGGRAPRSLSEKPSLPWPRSSSHFASPSSSSCPGRSCQLAGVEIAELSNKRCLTFRSEMCLHLITFLSNVKLLCSGKPWALCPCKRQRDSLSSNS